MGLFYSYCKYNTRIFSQLYFNRIRVTGTENIPKDNPVVLAANHPNSFLDAVLIGAALKRPTHFLARGDAFKNKYIRPVFESLNMLPIYRLSEGKENLNKNSETFDACSSILEKRGMVIIFAEGLSEHNWQLRPLRKGPARIAMSAWKSNGNAKDLVIVPVGLTYEHFSGEGKSVLINFGKPISQSDIPETQSDAIFVKQFNSTVYSSLEQLVYKDDGMAENDEQHNRFRKKLTSLLKTSENGVDILKKLRTTNNPSGKVKQHLLIRNTLIYYPLYRLTSYLAGKLVKQKLFFDSISFGLMIFLWPVYLLLLGGMLALVF